MHVNFASRLAFAQLQVVNLHLGTGCTTLASACMFLATEGRNQVLTRGDGDQGWLHPVVVWNLERQVCELLLDHACLLLVARQLAH